VKYLCCLFIAVLYASATSGDEIRPAFVQIIEQDGDFYSVLWKVPQDPRIQLQLVLPENCKATSPPDKQVGNGATITRSRVHCPGGMYGKRLHVAGLETTNTDVLVRVQKLDKLWFTHRLVPAAPSYELPVQGADDHVAKTYLLLGFEHILAGIDHLFFVFALLLIIGSKRELIVTVTSFTLAHSITLTLATLGFVHVPQPPVEAVIALSIVFLASEIIHKQRGRPGLASRAPWVVAFIFGLLHGFGFAGALSEIGLPPDAIPLALVFFNVGVEVGQLFFVLSVIALNELGKRMTSVSILERTESLATYCIGGLASFWLIERVVSL
jgi:hydrogenase/urease accessory protein HupE